MEDYLSSNWVPIICGSTILISGTLLAIFGWKHYKEKPKTEDLYQKLKKERLQKLEKILGEANQEQREQIIEAHNIASRYFEAKDIINKYKK